MRRGRVIVIMLGVLVVAIGTGILVWGVIHARPRVSAMVVGYTTNQAPPQMTKDIGSSTYVCAIVAVTNNSRHDFTYKLPVYGVLVETASGWRDVFVGATGPQEYTLRPGEGFTFDASIPINRRWKVVFRYNDGRKPSWIARRVPSWLTAKLPWLFPLPIATTEAIDLRARR